MILSKYGYVRTAAAVPRVTVADPAANGREIARLMLEGAEKGVSVMVFPELSVTGYTCADLFNQRGLLDAAEAALSDILDSTRDCGSWQPWGCPWRRTASCLTARCWSTGDGFSP
jgi:NAD+ synthase (glutamine-hydrolysing)